MQSRDLLNRDRFIREMSRSLIADVHHADDVAQEIWLSFLAGPAVAIRHPVAWISAAIRNRFRMLSRREIRRKKREEAAAMPERVPPADEVAAQEEIGLIVAEAVLGLDEPFRTPLLLRYYDHRPNREVAEILGISQEAVQSRMRRSLERVRKELTRKYNGDTKSWVLALAPCAGLKVGASAPAAAARAAGVLPKGGSPAFLLAAGTAALLLVGGVSLIAYSLLDRNGADTGISLPDRPGIFDSALPPEGEGDKGSPFADGSERIALTPSKGPDLQLTGRVETREGGRPIAGARVSVSWPTFEESRADQSAADGSFAIPIPLEAKETLHRCLLSISAPGYRNLETRLRQRARDCRLDLGIFYLGENPVHGIRVFGPEGAPISGAVLRFYKASNRKPTVEKVTGPDGRVKVSDQELARNKWVPDNLSLHVLAEGMADHFCFRIWSAIPMPARITMEPASQWSGRVMDGKTGLGVAGAKVWIGTRNWALQYPMTELDTLSTLTGTDGCFTLPRLVLENGRAFLGVRAPGYYVKKAPPGKFPREIRLESPASTREYLAVEEGSGFPLGGFGIKSDSGFYAVSDPSGHVRIPASEPEKESVFAIRTLLARRLTDLEDQWFFKGRFDPGGDGRETPRLAFVKIYEERLTVRVRDRGGKPVAGAIVSIDIDGVPESPQSCTDRSGCVTFSLSIPETRHARILVAHHDLYYPRPASIRLDPQGGEQGVTVVLDRGQLYQNIRVVNERGEPLARVSLEGRIRKAGGMEAVWGRVTDDEGLFDVSLPVFVEGCIEISERPGTRTHFDFEGLNAEGGAVLCIPDRTALDGVVEGVVTDSTGAPLKGVLVRAFLTAGVFSFENRANTDDSGAFSIPVPATGTYQLRFKPRLVRGKWHVADPRDGILTGDRVTIATREYTGVMVYFPSFEHRPDSSGRIQLPFLESPDGTAIESREVIRLGERVLFAGLPNGEMRAVMMTDWGARFESPLFEIKDGASLISMILME